MPEPVPADSAVRPPARVVVDLAEKPDDEFVASTERPVPEVSAVPLRTAILALNRAGFRVQLRSGGPVGHTRPAAGALAKPGAVVTLYREP
jgi:hypothetical protein